MRVPKPSLFWLSPSLVASSGHLTLVPDDRLSPGLSPSLCSSVSCTPLDPNMKLSLALTLATAAFTSAATLSTRAKGAGNTVHITSASDLCVHPRRRRETVADSADRGSCIIAPKGKHVSIGDSETSDGSGELSYCTKPTSGQGQLPSAFLKKVVYKAGSGKGKYVQVRLSMTRRSA